MCHREHMLVCIGETRGTSSGEPFKRFPPGYRGSGRKVLSQHNTPKSHSMTLFYTLNWNTRHLPSLKLQMYIQNQKSNSGGLALSCVFSYSGTVVERDQGGHLRRTLKMVSISLGCMLRFFLSVGSVLKGYWKSELSVLVSCLCFLFMVIIL